MKELPKTFKDFGKAHPSIRKAQQNLTQACAEAGPLDRKTRELIKIALSVASSLETATRRHTLMAAEHGATAEEVQHVVLMAITTCGYPAAMAGWQWANSALEDHSKER